MKIPQIIETLKEYKDGGLITHEIMEDALQSTIKVLGKLKEEKIFEIIKDIPTPFIEKFFPKNKCKERGRAIVLNAKSLIAITKALLKELEA